jgi:hypothetical protein
MYVIVERYLKLHETASVYMTCTVNNYTDSLHEARYTDWNCMGMEVKPTASHRAQRLINNQDRPHFALISRVSRKNKGSVGPLNILYDDPDFGLFPVCVCTVFSDISVLLSSGT